MLARRSTVVVKEPSISARGPPVLVKEPLTSATGPLVSGMVLLCRPEGFLRILDREPPILVRGPLIYRSEDLLAPYMPVGLLCRKMASCIAQGAL